MGKKTVISRRRKNADVDSDSDVDSIFRESQQESGVTTDMLVESNSYLEQIQDQTNELENLKKENAELKEKNSALKSQLLIDKGKELELENLFKLRYHEMKKTLAEMERTLQHATAQIFLAEGDMRSE
ncbi:hypothetical protein V6N13_030960 [Hibiscus sabdariffa]